MPCTAHERLLGYVELLEKWNYVFRLSGVRDPADMLRVQVFEALAILPYLGEPPCLDVGSGAGSPGMVLAIARPDMQFVLLDSRGRRTTFLQQVKIELNLDNVEVVQSRAEQYRPTRLAETVTARAVAGGAEVAAMTRDARSESARLLVMQSTADDTDLATLDGMGFRPESVPLKVPGVKAPRSVLVALSGKQVPNT